jgi:biotin transport system permease protein
MAGLVFHYFPANTVLHRWDARCKFMGLTIITLSLLHMNSPALTFFSALLLITTMVAKLPWRALLQNLKPWLLFLALIFAVQVIFHQSPAAVQSSGSLLDIYGLERAAIVCWRLSLMLCYAILFTSVTQPRAMQDAVTWFLQPFPFIQARRVGMMITLTIRFFPLVLDQFRDVQMAVKCRFGDRSRRPFRRIKFLLVPLFRRALIRSDEIAFALAARGYREDLPLRLPQIPPRHALALALVAVLALASVYML